MRRLKMMRMGKLFVWAAIGGCGLWTTALQGEVQYPEGTQDFEGMSLGDSVTTLPLWVFVNTPPESPYTVVATNTVLGMVEPRDGSTQWLRIDDNDAGNVQNRFYTPEIIAPMTENYTWTFYINLEAVPPGGAAVKPRVVIQHLNSGAFTNVWGIEFTDVGANLIVVGPGGPAASTPLYALVSPTGVGDWVKIRLMVDFTANTVAARINDGPPVSLPILPAGTLDPTIFRWCYRGEGTGNVNEMLVDDITVEVGAAQTIPAMSTWGAAALGVLLLGAGAYYLARRVRQTPAVS